MNQNYEILKHDEKNVMNAFYDCFLNIIKFFKKQIDLISKDINTDENNWEKIFDLALSEDDRNIRNIRDILDECIWLIQKHEPRANHLRLLIAIINSLNDLKRMSSYIVTFTKFFVKSSTKLQNEQIKKNIIDIGIFCLGYVNEYYSIISKSDLEDIMEKATVLFDKFLKDYKKIYHNFINELEKTQDSSLMANYIIVLKNIDRHIDHCMNIVENLSSIR